MKHITFRQRLWRLLPAIALTLVLALLWKSLIFKDQPMAKEKLHQTFPAFELYDQNTKKVVNSKSLKGKPYVVHIWASWCSACVKEHPVIMDIHSKTPIMMVSVLHRDAPNKAMSILSKKGNPYRYVLNDRTGKIGQSLGIMGIPETYVVDGKGQIRFQHSGMLDKSTIKNQLMPTIEKLTNESQS